MVDENEKLKSEVCKRMQAIDDEMDIILGMVNSFAFPKNNSIFFRPKPANSGFFYAQNNIKAVAKT